jgi:uncharacterized protein
MGMLIKPCNSVHMFGMRYAIDVVFLDASGAATKLVTNLRPWQMSGSFGARSALELSAGSIARLRIVVGSKLAFN